MIREPSLSFHLREELQLTWGKSGEEATESKHQMQGVLEGKAEQHGLLGPGSGQSPSARELIREIQNIYIYFFFFSPGNNGQRNLRVCRISALDINKGFSY